MDAALWNRVYASRRAFIDDEPLVDMSLPDDERQIRVVREATAHIIEQLDHAQRPHDVEIILLGHRSSAADCDDRISVHINLKHAEKR